MQKITITSISLLAVFGFALFLFSKIGARSTPTANWRPSYTHKDKHPYGSWVLYESLPKLFPNSNISTNRKQPSKFFYQDDEVPSKYLIVNQDFQPSDEDWTAMKYYVEQGNTLYIAASEWGENVMQDLRETDNYISNTTVRDTISLFQNPYLASHNPVVVNDTLLHKSFTRLEADSYTGFLNKLVHAKYDKEDVLVEIEYGDLGGRFFICSTPMPFTNYYLLRPDMNQAGTASALLSVLEPDYKSLVWDDFYKMNNPSRFGNDNQNAFMRFILAQPALRLALWLTLALSGLYVLFEMKRRQRIIPVIPPLRNSYLDFTSTIGRLYYRSQDHGNIAEKKIRYFLEHIRKRYYLQTHNLDAEFVSILSNKTLLPPQSIHDITRNIAYIRKNTNIAEEDLVRLSSLLDDFYEKTK